MGERVILILLVGFISAVFGIMITIIGYSMKKRGVKTNSWNATFNTDGQIISLKEKSTGKEITFHASDITDITKQSNNHMFNAVVSLKDETKITLYNLSQERYVQISQLKT